MKYYIFGALDCDIIKTPEKDDFVIACDGGVAVLKKYGIVPNVTIGDFDSLGYVPKGDKVITLPVKKDLTDVAYALEYACSLGADEIYIYGASGGKLDHTMANIQLSQMYSQKNVFCVFFGKTNFCSITDAGLKFPKSTGRLSVFAEGKAEGVSLKNLTYSLENAELNLFPLGVSNSFAEKEATVIVKKGTLTVMWEDETIPEMIEAEII